MKKNIISFRAVTEIIVVLGYWKDDQIVTVYSTGDEEVTGDSIVVNIGSRKIKK
jgi:hypothetical protein